VLNPHDDVSLRRVINVPARGIGKGVMESLEAVEVARRRPAAAARRPAAGGQRHLALGQADLRVERRLLRREPSPRSPAFATCSSR
jgi:hypothetical protein